MTMSSPSGKRRGVLAPRTPASDHAASRDFLPRVLYVSLVTLLLLSAPGGSNCTRHQGHARGHNVAALSGDQGHSRGGQRDAEAAKGKAAGSEELIRFSPENRPTCIYENVTYPSGHKFRPDPCTYCRCPRTGGRPRCAVQDCYKEPSCVRYHKPEDECCGVCVEFGCLHSDGKSYPPGAVVLNSACETCRCPDKGGRTVCERVRCPPITCVDSVKKPGQCCPACPSGSNCWLGERLLRAGVTVQVSKCKRCFCPETPVHKSWTANDRIHQPRAICTFDQCE